MLKDKKNAVLFVVIALILGVGVIVFLFGAEDAGQQQPVSNQSTQAAPLTSSQQDAAQVKTPLSASQEEMASDAESSLESSFIDANDTLANGEPEQENPYFNHEVKARLMQVADAYAEQIKYPAFSMPISSEEALQKYLPNRSFETERALDLQDENSPLIHLQTDKLQYFRGENINATVTLSGLTSNPQISVEARLISLGQTLATADVLTSGQQAATYQMIFSGLDSILDSGSTEYRVVASINIDGRAYEIGTPVYYVASIARVEYVGMAQVNGAYLNIPVNVTTTKLGYHRLTAILYSAQSGQPLVSLNAVQDLQSANDLMQLQASWSALEKGDEGPYLLKEIYFSRMASPPDFTEEYGSSAQDSYTVNGYGFEEYDDNLDEDEGSQDSLEFMRQDAM